MDNLSYKFDPRKLVAYRRKASGRLARRAPGRPELDEIGQWSFGCETDAGANRDSAAKADLAAICGGVAHVVAFDHVDDVFRDVCGVVSDAFHILGNED